MFIADNWLLRRLCSVLVVLMSQAVHGQSTIIKNPVRTARRLEHSNAPGKWHVELFDVRDGTESERLHAEKVQIQNLMRCKPFKFQRVQCSNAKMD
jgi:hypothetical protein